MGMAQGANDRMNVKRTLSAIFCVDTAMNCEQHPAHRIENLFERIQTRRVLIADPINWQFQRRRFEELADLSRSFPSSLSQRCLLLCVNCSRSNQPEINPSNTTATHGGTVSATAMLPTPSPAGTVDQPGEWRFIDWQVHQRRYKSQAQFLHTKPRS